MQDVAIIGVGMTPFGRLEADIIDLAIQAGQLAIKDCGIDRKRIEAMYLGNFCGEVLTGQSLLAALTAKGLGLKNIPVTKVEGACASGGIALKNAVDAVACGRVEFALAIGVEKMTSAGTGKVTGALAGALDQNLDGNSGLTFPGFFGLVARRYIEEYQSSMSSISRVVVKSRKNAVNNPVCNLRQEVDIETVRRSYPVAKPLHLMDCCPISDGAAAAIVCSLNTARKISKHPIRVLAAVQTSGHTRISDVQSILSFEATVKAAELAYRLANVTPADIDVVELHDCFSIAEIVDSEDLGFFGYGEGAMAAQAGATYVDGDIPINPSGGLLSRGHPVGATGLAQVYELVQQLRGTAVNQVKGAQVALAHNLGGTGATCTVTVLAQDI